MCAMNNPPQEHETPVLIGYVPKRRTPAPEQLRAAGVEEIGSVSECLAPGPQNWAEAWLHNAHSCFSSPDDARRVIADATGEFQILAYRLLPLRFRKGHAGPIEVSPLEITPLTPGFRSLGFDVVSRSVSDAFECSPLACNLMALEVAVNRHCLLNDLERQGAGPPLLGGGTGARAVLRGRGLARSPGLSRHVAR